ncbi:hypothetical protein RCO27_17100 [Sphingosinicella sp. LHD-64]|uniref:hypothetical protein n=1 Tax=Sphingosinicella sp. LHD-64 TaxID=3072139 RepID=UPI00280C43FD|nr:hypothetical protein [Sphingosinicella sp. LHD-64]MDQ8757945.1 hypothetical protein [Sphingosinicella sp. LHD-64]
MQLTLAPAELARRAGVTFARDHDSLDDFDAAVIDLGEGRSFGLQHHLNAPHPGTVVLLEAGNDEGVRDVVRVLKLKRQEITWAAPQLVRAVERAFAGRKAKGLADALIATAATTAAVAATVKLGMTAGMRGSKKASRSGGRKTSG